LNRSMEPCRVELVHHWPEKGVPWLRKKQLGTEKPRAGSGFPIPGTPYRTPKMSMASPELSR